MLDFLLILLMIFPWVWMGITFWAMKTQNTQHWLYKGWIWFHLWLISFYSYFVMLYPIMLVFVGIIMIPLGIWGELKMLRSLGYNRLKTYRNYTILSLVLLGIVSVLTNNERMDKDPEIIVVLMGALFWLISLILMYRLPKEKS